MHTFWDIVLQDRSNTVSGSTCLFNNFFKGQIMKGRVGWTCQVSIIRGEASSSLPPFGYYSVKREGLLFYTVQQSLQIQGTTYCHWKA